MHKVEIRPAIVERVLARRGRLHLYDSLDPKRTALLVIDMQNAFVAPGAPIEVPAAPRPPPPSPAVPSCRSSILGSRPPQATCAWQRTVIARSSAILLF